MRKKVLYVITKSNWGGAQRYVYDLAINLPKDKFEVVVAAGGNGPLFEKLQKSGIRTIMISGLQRDINLFQEIISLWHLFKIFIAEKPYVIHLNSTKAGGLGAVAAKTASLVTGRRLRVTFTVHGWGFKEDRSWLSRGIIFFFSWLSTLFHDTVILINTADYRTAQKFIPQKKLALVFNGIGPIDFLPQETAREFLSKKIGAEISADALVIGTIAELTKNKGLPILLESLSRLNHDSGCGGLISIVIGAGDQKKELEAYIGSLLLKNIYLTGFVPEASRYLKAFDIFVLSSLKEGLPYTIMEAIAAGLPIVATKVGGIPDLIEDRVDGLLVPPQKVNALSDALQKLIKDRGVRARFSKNAREKLNENFQLQEMLKKTAALYE